jgi:hypothetical protein
MTRIKRKMKMDAWGEMYRERAEKAEAESERLRAALEQSVKLQSHYAGLLNDWDGGHRLRFASADAWLERLAATRVAWLKD